MKELLKWLQGLGAGIVVEVYQHLTAAKAAADAAGIVSLETLLHIVILGALVRAVGYLVGKLPAGA